METPLNLKPAAEITYGNKVYRFYTAGIPYALAERYCEELGGNLVKIESEEKNNVIAQKVKELNKTFYIGASDEKEEGKFVWRDGSAVTYTNWSQNEPIIRLTAGEKTMYKCMQTVNGTIIQGRV